jgi:MFS family permease
MNRYIVGQVTFLFGFCATVVMAFAPSVLGPNAAALLGTCRTACVVMAIVGMVLAPIAFLRERPPALAIVGGILCVLALGWHYVAWTFWLIAFAVGICLSFFCFWPAVDLVSLGCRGISSIAHGIWRNTKSSNENHHREKNRIP